MSEIAVTRHDWKSIFDANLEDTIVFHLEENPTTGYRWEVESLEGSVLEFIESIYVPAPGMAMGRGGMRIIRFAARLPGSQKIRLKLRRQWDPPDKILEHMEATVRVLKNDEG